ncbi:MAG: UDP-N-acetylmuramate dehydrogenase [Patescibacteria group bacterium]
MTVAAQKGFNIKVMALLQERISLKPMLRYHIGGLARYFCDAKNIKDLKVVLKDAKKKKIPVFVFGGGTNILMNDHEFPGLVLRVSIPGIVRKGNRITVGAGVLMSDLLKFTAKEGLSGFEWAGGLPGTTGGAVRGNAGCFGGETKDRVYSVKVLEISTLRVKTFAKKQCGFTYRSSIFKKKDGKYIILSATFVCEKGEKKKINASIAEKIKHREARHPLDYPNIGSIFKNVPWSDLSKKYQEEFAHLKKTDPFSVLPTPVLIEQAGLKGVSCGGAMISPKHGNFIVNVCDAKASDVHALIALAKGEVKRKYKIDLEPEVILV